MKMVKYRTSKPIREEKTVIPDYKKIVDGMYEVKGSDPIPYRTDLINHSCTCAAWMFGNYPRHNDLKNCKHLDKMREVDKIEKKRSIRSESVTRSKVQHKDSGSQTKQE